MHCFFELSPIRHSSFPAHQAAVVLTEHVFNLFTKSDGVATHGKTNSGSDRHVGLFTSSLLSIVNELFHGFTGFQKIRRERLFMSMERSGELSRYLACPKINWMES